MVIPLTHVMALTALAEDTHEHGRFESLARGLSRDPDTGAIALEHLLALLREAVSELAPGWPISDRQVTLVTKALLAPGTCTATQLVGLMRCARGAAKPPGITPSRTWLSAAAALVAVWNSSACLNGGYPVQNLQRIARTVMSNVGDTGTADEEVDGRG